MTNEQFAVFLQEQAFKLQIIIEGIQDSFPEEVTFDCLDGLMAHQKNLDLYAGMLMGKQ